MPDLILIEDLLKAARERLAWLLEEYGDDDIDYVTFKPIVDELERRQRDLAA